MSVDEGPGSPEGADDGSGGVDGAEEARLQALEREGDVAADYLEELLDIADLDGDLDMDVDGDRAAVSIVGADLSQLVGQRGEVLDALQELTRLAVYRETGERSRLMLDVSGYRADQRARLVALAQERRTMVFFESPHRLADALVDAAAAFGDSREAAVCRELTKTYEEIRRGPLAELAEWAAEGVRGEITLVVGGAPEVSVSLTGAELAAAVAEEEAAGATRKDAIRAVVVRTGLPRRTVYDAVLAAKSPSPEA
ncbi:MAG TPA: SAM-dependent methyltransferase [Nocardioides sp.]|nr:SAM-dependent methyltransferase [Nocardioides sp.]